MSNDRYISAFSTRYASDQMQYLFSSDKKYTTWRKLWIALAEAEQKLGLNITDEQIAQMKENSDVIDYENVAKHEKALRHDVMAHIHAFGDVAPIAMPIIHLGATSCYVTDNGDMVVMREALQLVRKKLVATIKNLALFAEKYKDMPTLGYTHLQPAQLTTVGKRATLWMYDLVLDLEDLDYTIESLAFRSTKGTTGTQASFMELFANDEAKVKELEKLVAKSFDFDKILAVSGQTYTRKFDSRIMNVLSSIAQSSYKFASDMRILQANKEMEEPFEKHQVGSSAMPYKRNPMRAERICALARYVICDSLNPAMTAATQWFERTLDDSANKRIAMSEAFLGVDAILNLYMNITSALVVYPKIIARRVNNELPFMASENILMEAVKKGGSRQALHEKLRVYSIEAGKKVKEEGLDNDFLQRICADAEFGLNEADIEKILDPKLYIGRCISQVEEFINEYAKPLYEDDDQAVSCELKV